MLPLQGGKGAVDFARFAGSFAAKPVLATAKVQLLRGKVAALLDNRSLWIDLPAAASAKLGAERLLGVRRTGYKKS